MRVENPSGTLTSGLNQGFGVLVAVVQIRLPGNPLPRPASGFPPFGFTTMKCSVAQVLMSRLKAKRFRQIFKYLDQKQDGFIDLLDLTTGKPQGLT